MLISPSIYKVIGNKGCNSYIIETPCGLVIIDVGFLGSDAKIVRYIDAQLGTSTSDVSYIILTHGHKDVCEALPDLKAYCENAEIIIHEGDVNLLKRYTFLPEEETLKVMKGDIMELKDAEITIYHTPGHTRGSISIKYHDSLFCGDLVYVSHTGISLPRQNFDKKMLLNSLMKISQLSFNSLFPAHGRYILNNASSLLRDFLKKVQQSDS